jgi:hypothetical protein
MCGNAAHADYASYPNTKKERKKERSQAEMGLLFEGEDSEEEPASPNYHSRSVVTVNIKTTTLNLLIKLSKE